MNLDGDIDGDEYFIIDSHVAQSGLVFGYGVAHIDADDYFYIDSNLETSKEVVL